MPSPSDPIRLWNQRQRTVFTVGGVAVLAVLSWSAWPLPAPPLIDTPLADPTPPTKDVSHDGTEHIEPFDIGAFTAAIWNPAPEAPTVATGPRARPALPPPPKLQLIGIARDTDEHGNPVLRAALYDPDTDRLHLVASGEHIGPVTIAAVDTEGVSLEIGGRTSRIALRDDDREGHQ
ncbi:MAG: hypothetical protein Q9O74_00975 [Planctomycetota bacterium]|nr:hypothetical protein [Planctomycetota bacterium]